MTRDARRPAQWARGLALLALFLFAARAESASFLPTAEKGALVVVGSAGAPTRVDVHGYRAPMRIDKRVAGEAASKSAIVAWEELAPNRPPRLAEGKRVLVVLEPLPSSSLWQKRFAGEKQPVYVIADESRGLVPLPPPPVVEALTGYLALPPERRGQAPGIAALADLTRFDSPLALEAVERLGQVPDLAGGIDKKATETLAALAQNGRRPLELRIAVVSLAGGSRLVGLKPTLEKIARPGNELEAPALTSLAQLEGGFAPERAAALLERKQAAVRAVGARTLSGPLAERELPPLVRRDPSPLVRLAAAESLAASGTVWGMEGAVEALADTDAGVRSAAAEAIASRGAQAVPFLQTALRADSPSAPGAVVALSLMGAPGREVLTTTAASHPDAKIRSLAQIALGKGPGHGH